MVCDLGSGEVADAELEVTCQVKGRTFPFIHQSFDAINSETSQRAFGCAPLPKAIWSAVHMEDTVIALVAKFAEWFRRCFSPFISGRQDIIDRRRMNKVLRSHSRRLSMRRLYSFLRNAVCSDIHISKSLYDCSSFAHEFYT